MMPDLVIRTRPYHIRFHYQSRTFGDHPEYFKCESFQKFAITLKNGPIQSTEFLRMKNSRQRPALTILCQNQFTVFKLLLSRDKLSLYCWATAFACMIRMKRKKKVNFVIVVNSNASTCWRLTFKLWIIISGSWLVILNSKSRQVRGQEQSWFYTDWLVTGVPRKKWFSSLLTLFFLAICITVLLFLVYGVSNVSMMNAAIIRIWNCFTVVASSWDFLLSIPQ